MCGIAGIIGNRISSGKDEIKCMVDQLSHRGPDADGFYLDDQVALGHRRLSIIDLSTGANQPLSDTTHRYVIVFNGEIYNYREIRNQLDYPWKTNSDTETIIAAYIKWGPGCLHYLNGMFAFALYDKVERSVFIARDRLGVKPLYYYQSDSVFLFSSEVRSLLASGFIDRRININGLKGYLHSIAVPTPQSIVEGVQQVCPGEYLVVKENQIHKKRYWLIDDCLYGTIQQSGIPTKYKDICIETRRLLEQAVQSRMVADVRVGAFLSGGIDSSAVVALMSGNSDRPIDTFSIIFNEKQYDESEYARIIARKYNTHHTELLLKPTDIVENLDEYIRSVDTPTVDGINTFFVSKLVAQTGIKVALSGIGGDELFAGYPGFQRWRWYAKGNSLYHNPLTRNAFSIINQHIRKRSLVKIAALANLKGQDNHRFYEINRANFMKDEIEKLLKYSSENNLSDWISLNSQQINCLPLYSQYSIAELTHYTLDVLLKDTDQMSMRWSLEVREPFFDYHLIEFLLNVPDKHKYAKNTPKKLLVDSLGDLLPDEIIYRPKMGFSFPWDVWIRNELRPFCEQSLEYLKENELFDKKEIENIWFRFLINDKSINWVQIWSLVVLSRWLQINRFN